MRRTPIKRKTPLRSWPPTRRHLPMRSRAWKSRGRGEFADESRLAWLRLRSCRACGACPCGVAHHLRHDEHGASLGAHIKDDRRAISLCPQCHHDRHALAGRFSCWTRSDVQLWENEQLALQRAEYLRDHECGPNYEAMAF